MIIPQLTGGLCNQLFQIAACFSYASQTNNVLAINYNLPFTAHQGKHPSTYKHTLYKNIIETHHIPQQRYKQPSFVYSDIPYFADAIFEGCYQSFKYVKKYRKEISELFEFNSEVVSKVNHVLEKINTPVCTIHIRRGDYLSPQIAEVHNICNKEYYYRCLKNIRPDATILVVTDDRNYVLSEFRDEFETGKFIIANSVSELEDLYLLTQSDIIIGCNSTFSWWGAFLNKKLQQCLLPSRWFTSAGELRYGKPELYTDYITTVTI